MERLKIDTEYPLPKVAPQDMTKMLEKIITKICHADKLTENEYFDFMTDYLVYIASRDGIDNINIKISSKLHPLTTMGTIMPDDKNPGLVFINEYCDGFFRFTSFRDLFEMIDALEHEISHNFDLKYMPNTYLKFVCENGKDAYITSGVPKVFSGLFENHEFLDCATRWSKDQYFSMHAEQFARRRAYLNTKTFLKTILKYAKVARVPTRQVSKIVHGFVKYEKEIMADEKERMQSAKDFFAGKASVAGKTINDIKFAWNNFIEHLCTDNLEDLSYISPKKIDLVQKDLSYFVQLCNLKVLYNQENIDKLFAWQLGKEKLDLGLLMCIICQKRNTASEKQLGWLWEKLKGSEEEQKFYTACEKLFAKEEEKPLVNPNILEK